ncbi:Competence protein ComEA [Planctomycetales bacterium 10988]|nr:Competence protein ComEA [Planctomycetales bacterium 10988]
MAEKHPWLRRSDQAVIAGIHLLCLGLMIATWLQRGGPQQELIEFEQLPIQTIPYRVDLNRAGWPELTQLPDIGEILAKRIVAYREEHGPFVKIADLQKVNGIGQKTFVKLEPFFLPLNSSQASSLTDSPY